MTGKLFAQSQEKKEKEKPETNIRDAFEIPRNKHSMPGKFPGKVVQVVDEKSVINNKPDLKTVNEMLKKSMLKLTGTANLKQAWRQFVNEDEVIGLKVNPVAGKLLSTSLEITRAVIEQLKEAGIPEKNIVIWDRREFELHEVGFNEKNFPGIKITGTEIKDKDGSFFDKDGKQYGEKMIDKGWYYWADCEQKYDAETLPYMINEGKYSYFSKIVTQQVDKIINIPILKNAGPTVTLCLKNLAYGAVTNTARLHKPLWSETCAQVPAFAPLRDKVVLNIVDGIIGCYNGGPGANPQFITEYKTLLVGTDPVAVDRIGYEIVLKKRLDEKIQKVESPRGRVFMKLAEEYKLGVEDINKIELVRV
ncbi:MAG: DUF362 domain-containing protein [Calditrichia bacterium]|nr:DUF362 domain-containing protein [Calditrichia bacterium]